MLFSSSFSIHVCRITFIILCYLRYLLFKELPPVPAVASCSNRLVLPTATSRIQRIDALDWTKGALILFMVAYHAICYSAFRPVAFQYLAFLPPSFILITGFLVGQVYAAKYDLRTWKPYARLAIRGIKLLLIFLVLNLANCIFTAHSFVDGLFDFADRSYAIFLSGNGRMGIFEVLLPIAYFLLLAPMLLWLRGRAGDTIAVSAAFIFILCWALEMNGMFFKNLTLLSAGILGMALGLIPIRAINRFASRWILALFAYLVYRACSYLFGDRYVVQMLGAAVSVLVLYCCALHLRTTFWSGRQMVTLGKYSLLGYLAQIALLRVVVKVAGGKPSHWLGVFAVALVAAVLLLLVIRTVHKLRQQFRYLDLAYRAVFA